MRPQRPLHHVLPTAVFAGEDVGRVLVDVPSVGRPSVVGLAADLALEGLLQVLVLVVPEAGPGLEGRAAGFAAEGPLVGVHGGDVVLEEALHSEALAAVRALEVQLVEVHHEVVRESLSVGVRVPAVGAEERLLV